MIDKWYIGIDNGVSGTIGVVDGNKSYFIKTPVKKEQSYTVKKQGISRVEFHELYSFLRPFTRRPCFAMLERPLVNPKMFKTTMSAMRTLEAQVLILEALCIPLAYCDSKNWQKIMLPQGIKGSPQLKLASKDIGCRLFPAHKELITKHKDADGILIAEWARRVGL